MKIPWNKNKKGYSLKSKYDNTINDGEVIDLYLNKKISMHKIGKIFGFSTNVVNRILRRNNIKLRGSGRIKKERIIVFCKQCNKKKEDLIKRDFCSRKCCSLYYSGEKNPSKRPEVKKKISLANTGKKRSLEIKEQNRLRMLGTKASIETKKKMSLSHIGKNNGKRFPKELYPNFGMRNKNHSRETKKKLSEGLYEKYDKGIKKGAFEVGHKDLVPKESRIKAGKKISLAVSGEKSPHWLGGLSFEPYGSEFNKKRKEQIRIRDENICQECGKTQKKLKRTLGIHHIDYDKQNNNPLNLISLCTICHNKTNFSREHWERYFKMKMFIKEFFNPENLLVFNENKQLIGMDKIFIPKSKYLNRNTT